MMFDARDNKNLELSADFFRYCLNHPHERFWQALANWSGQTIKADDVDTFYRDGTTGKAGEESG